ncbi:type II secretion system protein [Candidatus Giovannonibacteria bacterium]|nr:type II secretion system protein [Candidatus Giovannonibacteria bacterium]
MRRGFTLLEILISLGVFSIAVFIILTVLFSVSDAQKKTIAVQNAQDNLRYAFEAMTKEIRTGKVFHCGTGGSLTSPQNCAYPNGESSFTFRNSAGQVVTYQVISNQLVKSSNGTIPCDPDPNDVTDCQKITAIDLVLIDKMVFYADGTLGSDSAQSRVTIVLDGEVQDPRNIGTAKINLQTTVSKRGLIDQP